MLFGALLALAMLWQAPEWQNSIRALTGLDPVTGFYSVQVVVVAVGTFVFAVAFAHLFRLVFRAASARLRRVLPRRVSKVIGFAAAVILFATVANGLFFRFTFHMLDSSFAELDALIDPKLPQPTDPRVTGSAASLLSWEDLGRTGREYVASGPTAAEIGRVTGQAALDPKVTAIREMVANGRVLMVGDGINDAPALAAAETGIAIGSGTDVAIEAAEVVLSSGDPASVPRAIRLSRAVMRNIRQNLFWAFAYNVALIPVAMGVLVPFDGPRLSPMLGAGAMALSSVFVVTNALRLRRFS